MRNYMINDIAVINKQNVYELRQNGKILAVFVMKNDGQLYEDDLCLKKITELLCSYIKGMKSETRISYQNRGLFFRQIPNDSAFGIYSPTGIQVGWITLGRTTGSYAEQALTVEKIMRVLSHRYLET